MKCEGGGDLDGGTCSDLPAQDPGQCSMGGNNSETPNPISVLTGAKIFRVTDWESGDGRLAIKRSYNSLAHGEYLQYRHNFLIGEKWSLGLLPQLRFSGGLFSNQFLFIHPDGRAEQFNCCDGSNFRTSTTKIAGGGYSEFSIDVDHSDPAGDFKRGTSTIIITDRVGTEFKFETRPVVDSFGNTTVEYTPLHMQYRDGYLINYAVTQFEEERFNRTARIIPRIDSLTDSFGRTIGFEYYVRDFIQREITPAAGNQRAVRQPPAPNDPSLGRSAHLGQISTINLPDGTALEYDYVGGNGFETTWQIDRLLTGVRHLDMLGETVIWQEGYLYEDPNFPLAITGIINAEGVRSHSVSYNAARRASRSQLANGVARMDVDYVQNSQSRWTHKTTNALGKETSYAVLRSKLSGRFYAESMTGEPSLNCRGDIQTLTYGVRNTGQGYHVEAATDREGRETLYSYDGLGQVVSETRAAGTPEAVTTTTQWDTDLRVKLSGTQAGLKTDYLRAPNGKLIGLRQMDIASGEARQWEYSYDGDGPNISAINGPLIGDSDRTFYAWDGAKLLSVTNALGQITQFAGHNAYDAPTRIVNPNGVETTINYDARQRPIQIIRDPLGRAATMQMAYDLNGNLTSVMSPNGTQLTLTYDAAQRVIAIENNAGERMEYTRNLMSTVTEMRVLDSAGAVQMQMQQAVDELNRVITQIAPPTLGGLTAQTQIEYDLADNPIGRTDARGGQWSQSFDALNRLVKEVDPLGAETDYGLAAVNDNRNPLGSVTDAREITTVYERNAFGEVMREISAEGGSTIYTRDARGLATSTTDARGVRVDYSYDAAGRLLGETYLGAPEDDVQYIYDEGAFGIGQLTAIIEGFGRTDYAYDSLGFLASETRSIGAQTYVTAYTYDAAGEVLSTTYPSGTRIVLTRDAIARVTDVSLVEPSGAVISLLTGASYKPFGPLSGAQMGDGYQLSLGYDQAYRATSLARSGAAGTLMDVSFVHDGVGDITAMSDKKRPERSQNFTYDPVSRLTRAQGGYGEIDYSYNLGGDRLSRTRTPAELMMAELTQSYEYDPVTTRLTSVTVDGSEARSFDYAPSGKMVQDAREDGVFDFDLNGRGRMREVRKDGVTVASYGYDIYQQRVTKSGTGTASLHYHYDEQGRLIAETDAATGQALREYVWFGLTPIAVLTADGQGVDDLCDPAVIADLQARVQDRQARLETLNTRIAALSETLGTRLDTQAAVTARRDTLQSVLDGVNPNNADRIADLTARIDRDEARLLELLNTIGSLETRLAEIETRVVALTEAVARLTARAARIEARCAGGVVSTGPTLSFIHSDHLGRPTFGTDEMGEVVWDGGITTPFGEQLQTMGALTQNLMFPGQYQDTETGYSYNWHRTYDPALGRYLQADPIGLDGGLNRYAYVGGNPTGWVDPTGEVAWAVGFAVFDIGMQLRSNGGRIDCINWKQVGLSMFGGGILRGMRGGAHILKKNGSRTWDATRAWMSRRKMKMNKPGQNRHHWLFQRNQGMGKYVPDKIKNQPWNINNVNREFNAMLNNKGLPAFLGAPGWAKDMAAGAGVMALGSSGNNCGC